MRMGMFDLLFLLGLILMAIKLFGVTCEYYATKAIIELSMRKPQ